MPPALLAVLVAASLIGGSTSSAGSSAAIAPPPHGAVLAPPPPGKIYHAANPGFGGPEDRVSGERIRRFEQGAGRHIAWAYFSNNWFDGVNFPARNIARIERAGRLPFVRLMARSGFRTGAADRRYKLQSIIDGDWDDPRPGSQGLRSWCRQAAALDGPLLAEFGTEVNGDWFPWNGRWNGAGRRDGYGDPALADGPERFRDAYRHIVDLCRAEGAEEITWFFHVDASSKPRRHWNRIAAYYPGEAYVDWIGVSFYGSQRRHEWESLRAGLDRAYPQLEALAAPGAKPLALLEWGAREERRQPRRKPRWIRAAGRDLSKRYPLLDAASWWNERFPDRGQRVDLRIDSSRRSLRAYRRVVSSPRFSAVPRFRPR